MARHEPEDAPRPAPGPPGVDRSETTRLLTLHQAAERLNVHYMTAYRWVRRGDLPAYKTGGRLRVRLSDVERFITERRLDVATSIPSDNQTDWDRHVDRLVELLIEGDGRGSRNEVQNVISGGATAGNVYIRLIAPALHRIGTAREQGEVNLAVEHRASEICVSIVAQLSDMFRWQGPTRGTAVTLTPPDGQHALAATMAADFLRAAGFHVHHLGSGVPPGDLAMFLKVVPADVVCFSVTRPIAADDYRQLTDASREANPDATVIFGGQGVDVTSATAVGANAMTGMVELAEHIATL